MSNSGTRRDSRVLAIMVALTAAIVGLLAIVAAAAQAQATSEPERPPQYQGHGSESYNVRLVGHESLDGRSAYQPVTAFNPIRDQWYTYVGEHAGEAVNRLTGELEPNGTSIVRVTNPRRPRLVKHIPANGVDPETGEPQNQAQMVRICNGEDLPAGDPEKVYMLRSNGNISHEIWDVTRPRHPALVSTPVDGLSGTHKSFWDCATGIGYLVGGAPGWKTERMTQVFDLSDPAHPVHIRDFGLPGQEPTAPAGMPVPSEVHGGIQLGNRFYNGYGTSAGGIFQILDVEKLLTGPAEPTVANLLFPQISRIGLPRFMGAHTTFPVLGIPVKDDEDFYWDTRDIVVISNESTANECREAHEQVFLVDITDELNPFGISNYKVKESEGNFCQRGGRFGSHSSNENMNDDYYRKIVWIAYFNAGIRAVDIRDPFHPREVGKYIPATTENTAERCVDNNDDRIDDVCKIAIQTNNLDTDDRNYVYAVDRANTGLHIVRPTGEARRIMRTPVQPNAEDDTPSFDELEGE
jgi:hypothetical protein